MSDRQHDDRSRIAANQTRAFKSQGNTASQGGAAACGIPASASAIEVNMTGTFATGDGYLRVAPTGVFIPNATFLNYEAGFNASNAGTIALNPGTAANFKVKAFVSPTHLVVDVLGYYVKGLFAVINSDGTLARGNGVVSTAGVSDTGYEVIFDRDVTGCAFSGNRANGDFNRSHGEIAVTKRLGNPNGVFVDLYNSGGLAETGFFQVMVTC